MCSDFINLIRYQSQKLLPFIAFIGIFGLLAMKNKQFEGVEGGIWEFHL